MKLTLAIMWTIVLIIDAISWFRGNDPSWILVFCPLIILVSDKWTAYLDEWSSKF